MPIAAIDFFRGAALSLLIAHPAFRSIEVMELGHGRFLVNGAIRLWLRHSKDKSPWRFALSAEDLAEMRHELTQGHKVRVGLVCGRDAVCALDERDLGRLLAPGDEGQTLVITREAGRQCRAAGPGGELGEAIPGIAFPDKLYA